MVAPMKSAGELSHKLSVSTRTVRKWARERRIPAKRVGKVWRFEEKAVLAALDERVERRI